MMGSPDSVSPKRTQDWRRSDPLANSLEGDPRVRGRIKQLEWFKPSLALPTYLHLNPRVSTY